MINKYMTSKSSGCRHGKSFLLPESKGNRQEVSRISKAIRIMAIHAYSQGFNGRQEMSNKTGNPARSVEFAHKKQVKT